MNPRIRVPIRVRPTPVAARGFAGRVPEVIDATQPVMERTPVTEAIPPAPPRRVKRAESGREAQKSKAQGHDELEMWRDRAQRLQAEMENFRKRQQRLADERAAADRERLLRAFMDVSDNLERALSAGETDAASLQQGVGLTHQAMARLLRQEGAELVQAQGQPFDPTRHEAVSTIPCQHTETEPDTVVEVLQAGYRIGDRLLRPARVIVAT